MFFNDNTIVVEQVTDEMKQWFLNQFNLEPSKYNIQAHTIRTKYSDCFGGPSLLKKGGPTHPMGDDFRYNGTEITFQNEEDAVQFKLTFAEDINKFDPNMYIEPW